MDLSRRMVITTISAALSAIGAAGIVSANETKKGWNEGLFALDLEENKDYYEPYEHAIFIATDTDSVFDGNGDEWVKASRNYEKVTFEESEGKSLSIDQARITGTTEMFVDPDGSDDNDGYSADAPKQTINAAIRDAALQQADRLIINLTEGTYTDDYTVAKLRETSLNSVEIIGETDENNDPTAIIDGGTGSYCVNVYGSTYAKLVDVELLGSNQPLNANEGGAVECENVRLIANEQTLRCFYIQSSSKFKFDENSVADISAATDANWLGAVVFSSTARIDGKLVGDKVLVKEHGVLYFAGNAIADGSGGDECMRIWEHSHAKIDSSTTFKNATTGIRAQGWANVAVTDDPTFESVTNPYSIRGAFFNNRSSDGFISLPYNGSEPNISDQANAFGLMDITNNGRARYYSTVHNGWMEMGRRVIKSGTSTVNGNSKTEIDNITTLDRLMEFNWHVSDTSGGDWALSETRENDGNGNVGYCIENEGSDDVTVRYSIYELER